jgi:hypothetical protein
MYINYPDVLSEFEVLYINYPDVLSEFEVVRKPVDIFQNLLVAYIGRGQFLGMWKTRELHNFFGNINSRSNDLSLILHYNFVKLKRSCEYFEL